MVQGRGPLAAVTSDFRQPTLANYRPVLRGRARKTRQDRDLPEIQGHGDEVDIHRVFAKLQLQVGAERK